MKGTAGTKHRPVGFFAVEIQLGKCQCAGGGIDRCTQNLEKKLLCELESHPMRLMLPMMLLLHTLTTPILDVVVTSQ